MIASNSSHDKEKEQCLLLCINVSELSSYHVATSYSVLLHALVLHLSIIDCHKDAIAIMELGVLQTIKVAIRNGKFTYCRSQIVHEACSSHA